MPSRQKWATHWKECLDKPVPPEKEVLLQSIIIKQVLLYYLSKCLRRKWDMKLSSAGTFEEEEVTTKLSFFSRTGMVFICEPQKQAAVQREISIRCWGWGPLCMRLLCSSTWHMILQPWMGKFPSITRNISPWLILQAVNREFEFKKLLGEITFCKTGAHQRKKSVVSLPQKRNINKSAIMIACGSVTIK